MYIYKKILSQLTIVKGARKRQGPHKKIGEEQVCFGDDEKDRERERDLRDLYYLLDFVFILYFR